MLFFFYADGTGGTGVWRYGAVGDIRYRSICGMSKDIAAEKKDACGEKEDGVRGHCWSRWDFGKISDRWKTVCNFLEVKVTRRWNNGWLNSLDCQRRNVLRLMIDRVLVSSK